MNLADLKLLTAERLKDAKALLQKKRYSFAYHAAGFAVECALKACVLSQMVHTGYIFKTDGREKKPLRELFHSHDFQHLIQVAGLNDKLEAYLRESAANRTAFPLHWKTVLEWKVEERYTTKTKGEAETLFRAITAKPDGVLVWIKKYWRISLPSKKGSSSSAESPGAGE